MVNSPLSLAAWRKELVLPPLARRYQARRDDGCRCSDDDWALGLAIWIFQNQIYIIYIRLLDLMGFYSDLMGFYSDFMGFYSDLMGFYSDFMGFYSDFMGFYSDFMGFL